MNNKSILIIGGTDGIGRALANELVRSNKVLIVGRSKEKAQAFKKANPTNGHYLLSDVSLLKNIRALVTEIKATLDSLDVIIHTADILRVKRLNTEEGLEMSIALNYYSRFLINQLLMGEDPKFVPGRMMHIAAAGFPPSKRFMNNFPLPARANSFKGHGIGQIANDFYGLTMAEKLKALGVKVNILNPGIVDTDIRRNGQFPKFIKILSPIFGFLLRNRQKSPQEYAMIPLSILRGENPDAEHFVLINSKGKGINGNTTLNERDTQHELYQFTTERIAGILGSEKGIAWL
ncbi:MAG: SDR family NAD(P)-dependent oxidoreductase [Bacteroidota bacterium]